MVTHKLGSLDILRSLAVLMVCACHFGHPLINAAAPLDLYRIFSTYGKYGVHIFFVVSGFVIPYSLFKAHYTIGNYWLFLLKRICRLHPPYLAGLLLTLVLTGVSYKIRHLPFPETTLSILKSTLYLHILDDNPVFWTLAVEMQFYVFIGLAYSLIMARPKQYVHLLAIGMTLLNQVAPGGYESFVNYSLFFFIGIYAFLIYTRQGSTSLNYGGILVLAVVCSTQSVPATIAALLSCATILTYSGAISRPVAFLGSLSYSLYIVHFPIGVKLINLATQAVGPPFYWVLFMVTLLVVIAAAWVFYIVVEKPSVQLTNKIRYKALPVPYSQLQPYSEKI